MWTALAILSLALMASATTDMEYRKTAMKALEKLTPGTSKTEIDNGVAIYQYLFGNYPELRSYFKGREDLTAEEVGNDPYFVQQGKNIVLALNILMSTYDNKPTFLSFTRDLIDRHVARNVRLDLSLYRDFFPIFADFLDARFGKMEAKEREALINIGNAFADEAQKHAKIVY